MIDFKHRGVLTDCDALADRLTQNGLDRRAAESKAELFVKAARTLLTPDQSDRHTEVAAFFVPGRIEVLGKHTDYAGGSSMVAAAQRGFCLIAWPRDDRQVNVTDAARGETIQFQLDPNLVPRNAHWSNYPMTVARRIARNFPAVCRGVDVAFASDLPPAAGMSSSSAMIVAFFLAFDAANALWSHPECPPDLFKEPNLAGYLGTVENGQSFGALQGDRGVGTFGGSEDHTAILYARSGRVSQYAYCPVRFERILPVPEGHTFAVGLSGVVAEKTGAAQQKYNRAANLVSAIMELWNRETGRDEPNLAAVLAGTREDVGRLQMFVQTAKPGAWKPAELAARLEHFITENQQIIPPAGDALVRGDLSEFGRLVDRSQQAAAQLLGNQIPQTSYLAAAARAHGAVAASAFGAGFGGSIWAMVETERIDSFLTAWAAAYRQEFPRQAEASAFFATAAGPATFRVC